MSAGVFPSKTGWSKLRAALSESNALGSTKAQESSSAYVLLLGIQSSFPVSNATCFDLKSGHFFLEEESHTVTLMN